MELWEEKAKSAYLGYEDEPTFIKAYYVELFTSLLFEG